MYQDSYNRGLGFEETFSDQPTPAYLSASSYLPNFAEWDWHEWALAIIGGYIVVRSLARGTSRAASAVYAPIKSRRKKRKRLSEAKKRYETERDSILG